MCFCVLDLHGCRAMLKMIFCNPKRYTEILFSGNRNIFQRAKNCDNIYHVFPYVQKKINIYDIKTYHKPMKIWSFTLCKFNRYFVKK